MKKQSFILALAFATFTLTGCGEKTQTPEEIATRQKDETLKEINKIRKENGIPTLTKEQRDSMEKDGSTESKFSAKHKMKSLYTK